MDRKQILWDPGLGTCPYCGCMTQVRMLSTSSYCTTLCLDCWNGTQDGCKLSVQEWAEEMTVTFVMRGRQEPSGASQGTACN